jgi:hypothetical protein
VGDRLDPAGEHAGGLAGGAKNRWGEACCARTGRDDFLEMGELKGSLLLRIPMRSNAPSYGFQVAWIILWKTFRT